MTVYWLVEMKVATLLTSNDAEKLLDPHVDVDAAKELVHVAAPALKDGATWRTWLGGRGSGAVFIHLAGKHPAEPIQHLLQPLQQQIQVIMITGANGPRSKFTVMFRPF